MKMPSEMTDNKRTRQIGPLQPSVGGHQSCSNPRNDNGDEANTTTTVSNSEEYHDKAAARLNLDEEQALEPLPLPIHKGKRPSLHHVSVLKHQGRVQLPQTIIKHETALSDEKMIKDQADINDIEQPSAPPRHDKCAHTDEPKETSLDADTESETSFNWVVPPRTRLVPSTPGNGRAVIPGAFEVTLRPPPSNDFSQYTEQDMVGVDNVDSSPGNDANIESSTLPSIATDEILQLTFATLVDEDREHALELENERLRKRVEGQTQAIAIAVNDSTNNKIPFWKSSWFYLIMVIVIVGMATLTGLAEQLRSQNDVPVTIFAPTNNAFQCLPGELRYQDPRGVIHMRGLLSKHCVQYDWMETLGFVDNTTLTMKNNESVLVSVQGNVNQRQAISLSPALEKDQVHLVSENAMLADNGDVVHVVDGLLKPNFYDLTLLDLAQQLNLTWILVFCRGG